MSRYVTRNHSRNPLFFIFFRQSAKDKLLRARKLLVILDSRNGQQFSPHSQLRVSCVIHFRLFPLTQQARQKILSTFPILFPAYAFSYANESRENFLNFFFFFHLSSLISKVSLYLENMYMIDTEFDVKGKMN